MPGQRPRHASDTRLKCGQQNRNLTKNHAHNNYNLCIELHTNWVCIPIYESVRVSVCVHAHKYINYWIKYWTLLFCIWWAGQMLCRIIWLVRQPVRAFSYFHAFIFSHLHISTMLFNYSLYLLIENQLNIWE